ncbi:MULTISPECIES: carboxylesterase family protein [unclassified Rathayibacter]|uniref:carboxylesterase family protein n=1 Tax=unclassified Rathayibacter TaxID=2609250 RepID=UPI0006F34013|nr:MULTISPECIES: carboxylesterase family protein [unclassified Rathayibacter]KQQ05942.1 hypothetical protein ASF42_05230 [Rathayibacter sp. Leaf294]KQS13799.1 hypothetical protein ASG06_05240 [Rathayibacter sp. Leaf185]
MSAAVRPAGGVRRGGAKAWLGIPFAAAARFAAPRVLPFEEAAHDAYGAAPFQIEDPNQPLGADPAEDSAFLNVWAPAEPGSGPLPVLVTVYGGGFEHGAGSSWAADGAALAASGRLVVVSFNYRVGALGFATVSAIDPRFPEASNLGLRDVIAALQWVHDEIERFGGDPAHVTVLGESAGGFLAAALAAAPSADGLYSRLAVHSAGASRILPPARAESMARGLIEALAASGHPDPATADPLELVRAQSTVVATDIGVRNGPSPQAFGVVDDSLAPSPVLTGHPAEAIRGGRILSVPILVSTTLDEIALFRSSAPDLFDPPSLDAVIAEVEGFGVARERAEEIVAAYGDPADDSPGAVRARLLTDYIYRLPALRLAETQASAGGEAHLFLVGRADGAPAGHAVDVAGLIGGHWPVSTPAADERDRAITAIVLDFATGSPLGWEAVSPGSPVAGRVGELAEEPVETFARIARLWDGVPRP